MTSAIINPNTIAFEAGYNAAVNKDLAAPAMCKVYMGLIEGMKVGEGAKSLADSWQAGYAKKVNEDLMALLAEDDE